MNEQNLECYNPTLAIAVGCKRTTPTFVVLITIITIFRTCFIPGINRLLLTNLPRYIGVL